MFDRLIFKGHLTRFFHPRAIRQFLWSQGTPLTEFARWAKQATTTLVDHAEALAAEAGRPSIYLRETVTRDSGESKEELARSIAARDGITEGLVCVLRTVESCYSFTVAHQAGRLEVIRRRRKCPWIYFYLIDPELGFIHVRVQSWLPFQIQIYVNGREWLARQLDQAGVGYLRHHNALLRVDDLDVAEQLCERFARRSWPAVLNVSARRINPLLPTINHANFGGYYWVTDQAEVATDVMFRDRPSLTAIMPDLVRHATLNLSAVDVLHLLGRKLHPQLAAEVLTDAKRRPKAGASNTVSPATRSRSTTRSRCCASRPRSTIRTSSASYASEPTMTASARGGGAR
jgi:hypothetical protein